MSLILPSSSAPAPAPSPSATASTRRDEQAQDNPGSFGEALARSLAPAAEKTDKPVAKTAPAQPARRQPGPEKTEAQDLTNAMVLSLLPIETRMPQAALPVGTGTATESAVPGTTLASLNDLLTRAPALTNGADGAADAPEAAADADAQARLASVLAAASQNSAGQPPLPTSLTPVTDGAAIQLDPLAMAAQARAAGTGSSDPSSRRDDKAAPTPGVLGDARADLAPAAPHGAPKVAADAAEPTAKSAARSVARSPVAADAAEPTAKSAAQSVVGSPVAEDATASASTALPMTPATAALQAPVSVAATNAPLPAATATATASVMPELGSPEWGKALSQQVVHMGNAGNQVAELQLNPPGLGPLKVTLSMNDHQIQAMFVSAHSSVRAAVEAALPQLRATLAESGISLGNTSVGAESQPQTAFANGQDGQRDRETYRPAGMDNTATRLQARTVTEPVQRNSGMRIDTYA